MNAARSDAGGVASAGRPTGAGVLPAPVRPPHRRRRISAIDLARGFAVTLMILSHGVNGLLSFDDFTELGWMLHAVTKFSSSLFVMVFGIALGVAFVPHVHSERWPAKRMKLLLTGLIVMFWYKILTIVEMNHLYEPEDIVEALLFIQFPSYVEILGFYAIALLWIPFVLPLWARLPAWAQWLGPLLMAALQMLLIRHFDFFGIEQLQAIVVEHPDYYTWGQLARGPLVLIGLLIGGLIVRGGGELAVLRRLALIAAAVGAGSLLTWAVLVAPDWHGALHAAARNAGKHPPELLFMLFSMGGALLLLALAFAGGEWLARMLRPITVIGSDALQAFIFHIVVIFVFFRLLFGWFHTVDYAFALTMAVLLVGATAAWIAGLRWIQRRA